MARRYARLVLIAGGLTAIATSAAEPYTRSAELEVAELEAGDVVHFTVHASEAAQLNAERFVVYVERWAPISGLVRVVPDDARFEPLVAGVQRVPCLECADGSAVEPDDDGGSQDAGAGGSRLVGVEAVFEILHEHCPDVGECTFGFSVEVLPNTPPATDARVDVKVEARVEREASGQMFCGPNRDFPSGARIEVVAR